MHERRVTWGATATQAHLLGMADELEAVHKHLYSRSADTAIPELTTLYERQTITMQPVGSGPSAAAAAAAAPQTTAVNLLECGKLVVHALRSISAMPLESLDVDTAPFQHACKVHYLDAVDTGLLFGHYFYGLPKGTLNSDAAQAALMLDDGCAEPSVGEACRAFHGGLLLNGLHAAVTEFEAVSASLVQARLTVQDAYTHNASLPQFAGSPLQSSTFAPSLTVIDTLASSHLAHGMAFSAQLYQDAMWRITRSFSRTTLAMTVSSSVVMALFYLLAYRPAVAKMDKDIRQTHSMLLLFPDEVIQGVERIRALLTDMSMAQQAQRG